MKLNVTSKFKLWLIITLVVIVAGMVMLGVFGINGTVTDGKSYEITVGVDQNIDQASAKAKESAEAFFSEKGLTDCDYAYQTMDGGNIHIYKFANATGVKAEELSAYVTEKLANDKVVVEAHVNEVVSSKTQQVWGVVIALVIAVAVIFVYLLIMEKLKATLSVLFSAVLSALLSLSLIALTRIPAIDTWALVVSASLTLSAVLSVVLVRRFKEQSRLYAKASSNEIVDSACSGSVLRFATVLIALVVVALLLGLIGGIGFVTFTALAVLVIAVSSVFVSFVWTPVIWSALNK